VVSASCADTVIAQLRPGVTYSCEENCRPTITASPSGAHAASTDPLTYLFMHAASELRETAFAGLSQSLAFTAKQKR